MPSTKDLAFNKKYYKLRNNFYIRLFMMKAGNDNTQIKKEISQIVANLEKLLI